MRKIKTQTWIFLAFAGYGLSLYLRNNSSRLSSLYAALAVITAALFLTYLIADLVEQRDHLLAEEMRSISMTGYILLIFSTMITWPERILLCSAIASLVILWISLAIIIGVRQQRLLQRLNAERPELPDEELLHEYCNHARVKYDTVKQVWHDIAADLQVDPGRLRPDDLLETFNGAPFRFIGWTGNLRKIIRRLYHAAGNKMPVLKELSTVDNVVFFIARNSQEVREAEDATA